MAKKETDLFQEQRSRGRIHARIIDAQTGLTELWEVYAVRIHSRNLNILIMNDYVPTLGQVQGDVMFLTPEGEHPYRQIKGFYKHQHNEFTLLVEEYLEKGARRP